MTAVSRQNDMNAMKPFLPPPLPMKHTRSVQRGVPSLRNTHVKSTNRHHSHGKNTSNGKYFRKRPYRSMWSVSIISSSLANTRRT